MKTITLSELEVKALQALMAESKSALGHLAFCEQVGHVDDNDAEDLDVGFDSLIESLRRQGITIEDY